MLKPWTQICTHIHTHVANMGGKFQYRNMSPKLKYSVNVYLVKKYTVHKTFDEKLIYVNESKKLNVRAKKCVKLYCSVYLKPGYWK
jgi:hypothetical protein